MASDVEIANRALVTKLGVTSIASLADDTVNARRVSGCSATLRDTLLRVIRALGLKLAVAPA